LWLKNLVLRPELCSVPLHAGVSLLSLVASVVVSECDQLPCASLFDVTHAVSSVEEVSEAFGLWIPVESLIIAVSGTVLDLGVSLLWEKHGVVVRHS